METILIVDDEAEIIRITRGYLEKAGYHVLAAMDGSAALATFRREEPDLVILDLNLPTAQDKAHTDGLDVARSIRQATGRSGNTPIIMLTARVEEADRIIGLELGADDYVTKPFSPRELVARVKAVLRRTLTSSSVGEGNQRPIRAGRVMIDPLRRLTTVDGFPLDLTPTEFTLLLTMAAAAGQVFTRSRLLDALGPDYEGLERTIDSHIKNLRAKLEKDPKNPMFIQTVFGVGYKFNHDG